MISDKINFTKFLEHKKRTPDFKPKLPPNFLTELLLEFSSIKLIKNSNEKISAGETFKQLDNDKHNLAEAVRYIFIETARSKFYSGGAAKNTQHCALVPLFMAAHKNYNNIGYESWDKEDKYIKIALGSNLYKAIADYNTVKEFLTPDNLKILREQALNYNGNPRNPASWPNHHVKIYKEVFEGDEDTELIHWKGSDLIRHIMLQTWMANVQFRNKYMLLDVENWDNIPESLDAHIVETTDEELLTFGNSDLF